MIFQMTFYNLELIQNFFPDHKVLIQSLIFFCEEPIQEAHHKRRQNWTFGVLPSNQYCSTFLSLALECKIIILLFKILLSSFFI